MRFLLVPGAGGDPWFWHRVVPLLEAAGHRAVAVELPAGDDAAGLGEYVEAAVHAGGRFGGDDGSALVVVGQSLGGFSAPTVAQRLQAAAIVLVNAMIPNPGETAGEWWAATGQDRAMAENDAREGRSPGGYDDQTYMLHDVPPEVLATSPGEPHQTGTVFAAAFPGWPDIPVRVIAGADDRFFPPAFQRDVARDRLGLDVRLVPGGHCAALSRPEELTAALLDAAADAIG